MVVLLVVLSIIVFVTITYFMQRKQKAALASAVKPQNTQWTSVFRSVPPGVFLQPSFTWGKLMDTGNLMIGVHPMILNLTGQPEKVDTLAEGTRIKKGEQLLKLHSQNKQLNIKSPVDGTVVSVNPEIKDNSLDNNWLYSIKPENISEEIQNWYVAEKATEWLKFKYEQIKSFLMQALPQDQMGITMADGGEIPFEVMKMMDQKIWTDFEARILQ